MSTDHQNSEREEFERIISETKVESDLLDKDVEALNNSVKDFVKRNSEVKDE